MRIGLYGMPTAGKTHVLNQLDFIDVKLGSNFYVKYVLILIQKMRLVKIWLEKNWLVCC